MNKDISREVKISKLGLISEAVAPHSEIILIGNKTLMIEGTSSILELNDDSIKLKLADLTVAVYGMSLCIAYINQDSLEINGRISRLEYL